MCAPLDSAPFYADDALVAGRPPCAGSANCNGACSRIAATLAPPANVNAKAAEPTDILDQLPLKIADDFTADILKPYRAHAKYLKSAEITSFCDKSAATDFTSDTSLVTAKGRFAIPESCYIDDTGHFNAVEFNICYNQLAYVLFGKCIEAGLLGRLRREKVNVLSFPEFKRHQLPSMVIVSIESRYYKQLQSDDFTGELVLNKISSVGDAWFFFTTISFADRGGVKAKGSVVLAFSPSFDPVRH